MTSAMPSSTPPAPFAFQPGPAALFAARAPEMRPTLIEVRRVSKVFGGRKPVVDWVKPHPDVVKTWQA
jgi:hypothetical protein